LTMTNGSSRVNNCVLELKTVVLVWDIVMWGWKKVVLVWCHWIFEFPWEQSGAINIGKT
jgi:hypothetical protein